MAVALEAVKLMGRLLRTSTLVGFLAACVLAVIFMYTGLKLNRWEGLTLMAMYGVFVGLTVAYARGMIG